jgi:hypothetical protein
MEQVRLEVVDIWHFGLSSLFEPDTDFEALAARIADDFTIGTPDESNDQRASQRIHAATEALAEHALAAKGFSVPLFQALMQACGLSADALYRHYVGKNVLNFFRQDHGYQEGTYIKEWRGREDNEHLSELLESLDATTVGFPEAVYEALASRYAEVT